MGCFLNGDDYGKPSDLPWAMEFPDGAPPTPFGIRVQPTQLYESFSSVLIFTVLMLARKKLKRDWAMTCLYLALAGLERFLVEFVRANRTGQSQQQILALVTTAVAGAAFIWIQTRPSPHPRGR
jgi:phosphatidylglycerol:prolipoprotein diacylglycerol transferase